MAQLEILTEGHPLLRQKALPVKKITKRLLKLAGDMKRPCGPLLVWVWRRPR